MARPPKKPPQRSNGLGSVYPHTSGRWCAAITLEVVKVAQDDGTVKRRTLRKVVFCADRAAAEAAPGLVDDEHPVGVAVEREADVEVAGDDARLQVELIRGLQRVGWVIGERAVELAVHDLEGDLWQALEHSGYD